MKCESELKSQEIKTCNANISHLSEEIKTLSSSLQEKEAAAAQLKSQLQTYQHFAGIPEQLLMLLKSVTQIAELECKLRRAEYQKQQAELEKDAAMQEMKAKEDLKLQLHAQLGKQWTSYKYPHFIFFTTGIQHFFSDEPPKVINHPQNLTKVCPETDVSFAVQATGTDPLRYQWQWKPVEEENKCDYWNPCDSEKFPGSDTSTVTIPNVQKTNEGSYRCVITNYAGSQTSKPAKLSIGKYL